MRKSSSLLMLLIAALVSCTSEPPKRFSMNEAIPMDAINIRISRIETGIIEKGLGHLRQSSPEFSKLDETGKTSAGVILEIAGIKTATAQDLKNGIEKIVPRGQMFSLIDKAGKEFSCLAVFPEYMLLYDDPGAAMDQMLNLGADPQAPRKYVAIFLVPKESSGFTFLIRNPAAKEGQPRLSAVALGK